MLNFINAVCNIVNAKLSECWIHGNGPIPLSFDMIL